MLLFSDNSLFNSPPQRKMSDIVDRNTCSEMYIDVRCTLKHDICLNEDKNKQSVRFCVLHLFFF